ncbi:uncharacterized protein LOC134258800 [Saccostrea cucullata]|uniref:uncharacterized protein LOC134258800 n=1 Tax=Saccostrea cuccullata TaxID=36930 RepID=UPI002ED1D409
MQIRKVTKPDQWSYISTDKNPADQATRQIPAQALQDSTWLSGPSLAHLQQTEYASIPYEMVDPDSDKDVGQEITCLKVDISGLGLKSERFLRFSQWRRLVETIARLQHIARSFHQRDSKCSGWHVCENSKTVESFDKAEKFIIKTVQSEVYSEEIQCILKEKPLPRDSNILPLSPFLDKDGILRVGGRLNKSSLPISEKNPVIIPRNHHIALLIARYYHELCIHQGRHFTAGAIRSAGFWIIGARRLVSSMLHYCVKCRKLRGKLLCQKMSDLPTDRLDPGPPFTYIGLDTFGPWEIVTRQTRGGSVNSKRWAILFTCLTTRGIHIEVVEELSSSSFINAFKRFEAIRGKVTQICSDQGTNFVGAINDLKIDSSGLNIADRKIRNFLYECGTTWKFNPPHSSHMGGAWERLIGVVRRVIDAVMLEIPARSLTHEILTTFMAEVSAIVNARPLVPLSEDADDPYPLSPSMILTQKTPVIVDFPVDKMNMYQAQWKRVQHMADLFWTRWRKEYLHTLQIRRKWTRIERNITKGDIVLLRDKNVHRNLWPMGAIVKTFPSDDGKVRKAEIHVVRRGCQPSTFIRPVTEIVLLLANDVV